MSHSGLVWQKWLSFGYPHNLFRVFADRLQNYKVLWNIYTNQKSEYPDDNVSMRKMIRLRILYMFVDILTHEAANLKELDAPAIISTRKTIVVNSCLHSYA